QIALQSLTTQLHDRRNEPDIDQIVLEAERLVGERDTATYEPRLTLSATVLTLRSSTRRLHHLEQLRDALAVIDTPRARLSCLSELDQCVVTEQVPPSLSSQLLGLVDGNLDD